MVDLKLSIPDTFFKEEVRWEYVISEKMKEVWAVELDLLAEFDRVCKKRNIEYMASGGTLLGAVRHHGFIPWDDDIDVMMRRDDYDKLCDIASDEFKSPYFFQLLQSDPAYPRAYAKLRNCTTTAIQESCRDAGFKFNQGIFIDIFPLDAVATTPYNRMIQKIKCNYYKNQVAYSVSLANHYSLLHTGKLYKIDKFLSRWFRSCKVIDPLYNMNKLEYYCKKYVSNWTEHLSKLSFQPKNKEQWISLQELEELVYFDFEFLKIPVPKGYDAILKRRYGNYLKPINTGGYHGDHYFDTNKSFKEYIKCF